MSKDNVTGTKKSKDLALKNNNPGNLRVVGSDTEFQEFSTMQEGFNALIKQLDLYKTGKSDNTTGNETLGELMNIYAPKKDKNNPDAYAKVLAEKLGITVDTLIKDIDTNKLAVAISSVESPDAYNALIKTKDIDLGVDIDVDGNPILANIIEKPKYVIGEDENGKYVETLVDKGQPKIEFDPNKRGSSSQPGERYIKQYVKGAEILSTRTIGDNEYIVKSYTDDDGELQDDYLSFTEKGANKYNLKKEDKVSLYRKEIDNVLEGGLTEENVFKAENILKTAEDDLARSIDAKIEKEDYKKINQIEKDYYEKAAIPFAQKELKEYSSYKQKQLIDLRNKYANAFGEEKDRIKKQLDLTNKQYTDFQSLQKDFNKKVYYVEQGATLTGAPPDYNFIGGSERLIRDKYLRYKELLGSEYSKFKQQPEYANYVKFLDDQKQAELDKKATAGTTTATKTTTFAPDVSTGPVVDPDDIDFTQEEIDVTGKDYIDKTYLEEQLAEVNKQLDNVQKAEEFTPDLSMLDNRDRYGNLIAMASDLGVGYMGLKGAMEEIPEYEKGEMFKAYTDEAYRQRNMGYTPEEIGLRKQLAERGFGYDVKNIRRLTGGSAGVALGNLGRAAGTLQNRYAQIAAEDSAIRRLNQQRFDRAASADETLNRRKFEDDFKVAMMNKEMGAQLVRDKMTDMRERQQFQQQYGKGSIYDAMSREMLKSQQYNVHALKMAEQYQKDKQQDFLKQRQADIQSKLNQANQ